MKRFAIGSIGLLAISACTSAPRPHGSTAFDAAMRFCGAPDAKMGSFNGAPAIFLSGSPKSVLAEQAKCLSAQMPGATVIVDSITSTTAN